MDKASKGTLANLAADQRHPSGADDDQVPAIAKLPAVLAARNCTPALVDEAVAITNANEVAAAWSRPAAALVRAAFQGGTPSDAVHAAINEAEPAIGEALRAARDSDQNDTAMFAGEVGRACPLPQALPVIVHIIARAASYQDAIERNILAGGDNCGRAPVLGALFGAYFGLGGSGVPLHWIGKLSGIETLTGEIRDLADFCG